MYMKIFLGSWHSNFKLSMAMVVHNVKTDRNENNNENYSPLLLQGAIPDYRHNEVQGESQNCRTFVVDVMKQVDSIQGHKRSSRNRKYSTQSIFPKDYVSACWTNLQFSNYKRVT
jgi:hypothetical protein